MYNCIFSEHSYVRVASSLAHTCIDTSNRSQRSLSPTPPLSARRGREKKNYNNKIAPSPSRISSTSFTNDLHVKAMKRTLLGFDDGKSITKLTTRLQCTDVEPKIDDGRKKKTIAGHTHTYTYIHPLR